MKKSSILIASMAAMLFSFNSFAGDGDAPKAGPKGESDITLATPNDDPNAPPPPPVTYNTVVWNGTAMNAAEQAYFSVLYNSTLTSTMSNPGTGTWPATGTTYKYMPISNGGCQSYFLSHSSCTGCRTGNVLFTAGPTVSSSFSVFVWGGCPL